jgi:hypothetical protein
MKIIRVLYALLLVSTFATPTAAHERAKKKIIAPPWSAACMTNHGPSECGEPMWIYGHCSDIARYRNAF